jgi:chitinase
MDGSGWDNKSLNETAWRLKVVLSLYPVTSNEAGPTPGNWPINPRLGRLLICNKTMLLDSNLFSSL